MTQSHKGSRLILKGQIIAVDFNSIYGNFDYDATLIQSGDVINPNGGTVYSLQPKSGVYGGGVAVEEGTINILPDPLTMPASTWQTRSNVTVTYNQLDPFGGTGAIKIHPNTTTDNAFGVTSDLVGTGTYSGSIWIKGSVEGKVVKLIIGDRATVGAFFETNIVLSTLWKKIVFAGSTTVNPTVNTIHIGGGGTWTDNSFDVWIFQPQLEGKPFETSFVNGSRAKGALIYDDSGLDHTQGTISFWYKPSIAWDNTTMSNASPAEPYVENLFSWGTSVSLTSLLVIRRERSAKKILAYFNGALQYSSVYNFTGTTPAMITYSWMNGQQKLYLNGLPVGTFTVAALLRPATGAFEIGGRTIESSTYASANGIIDDLRIDRTVASDEEIQAWYLSGVPFYNPYDKRSYAY
jgi:hypothetical protein